MIPILKGMIKNIAIYMSNKSRSNADYKAYLHMLDKYEELNLKTYVEGDESKMVFGNTTFKETEDIKESVANMCDSLNKYNHLSTEPACLLGEDSLRIV
jgi:hypothetical protein